MKNLISKSIIATALLAATFGVHARTYKFAANIPADGAPGLLLQEFADNVKEATEGRVTFRLFWNGTLGSQAQYAQQVQSGVIDMGLINSATLENLTPSIGVFNLPYIFRSNEEYAQTMSNEKVQEIMARDIANSNLNYVGYLNNGFRGIYVTKESSTMEDIKGLKIRTSPSDTYINMMEALDVVPTPLDFSEIYPALQQGVIDGAEGGLSALWELKFGEVARYAIRTDHSRLTDFVISSPKFKTAVSEGDLAIVYDEMKKVSNKSLTSIQDQINDSEAKAEKEMGVLFYTVDKEPLIEKMTPLYNSTAQDSAKKELLETVFEIQGRTL